MKRWKYSALCYMRDRKLIAGTVLYYVYLVFRLWQLTFVYSEYSTILEYTKGIERLSMYGSIVLLLCSYYYLNKMNEQNYAELLEAEEKGYKSYVNSRILLLGQWGLLFGTSISIASIIYCLKTGVTEALLIKHLALNVILYVFAPFLISILTGAVLSLWVKYKWAYTIIVFLWFGITPISEIIAFQLKNSGVNLYMVINYVKFGAPDLQWGINDLYGIPLERFHWALRIFWILILLYLLLYKIERNKRLYRTLILGVTSLCLPVLISQGSRVQQENGKRSGMAEWESYYNEAWETYNKIEKINEEAERPIYQIEEYDIDIKLGKELIGKAVLHIQDPQEKMFFSLFEGYKIKSIEDREGNKVDFKRDGHYIEVDSKEKGHLEEIAIEYRGYSQKFYSNNQGAYLPGYFPYYPMAGKRPILAYARADFEEGYTDYAGFNTDIENFNTKNFNLRVTGINQSVATNLERLDNNTWSGEAKTITILSGLVEEKSEERVDVYGAIGSWGLGECAEKLEQSCDEIKERWNLDVNTQYKKIFNIEPMINYMGTLGENTVDLGDHVIVTTGDDAQWAVDFLLNPITDNGGKELLKDVLRNRMITGFEEREKDIQMEMQPVEILNAELMDYYLNYKVSQYGEQKVVEKVVQYLKDDTIKENPQAFLKGM